MNNKTKEQEKDAKKQLALEESNLSGDVLNYDFADHVRLRSTPRGVIFSFAKLQPEEKEFVHFKQILIPFDVADSLSQVIQGHLNELVEKGLIKRVEQKREKNDR